MFQWNFVMEKLPEMFSSSEKEVITRQEPALVKDRCRLDFRKQSLFGREYVNGTNYGL